MEYHGIIWNQLWSIYDDNSFLLKGSAKHRIKNHRSPDWTPCHDRSIFSPMQNVRALGGWDCWWCQKLMFTISNFMENVDFVWGSNISPGHFAQAPACRLGSLARAAVEDGAHPVSLRDAAKVHHSHGERDAHRVFDKYWMSLKVPIDENTHRPSRRRWAC